MKNEHGTNDSPIIMKTAKKRALTDLSSLMKSVEKKDIIPQAKIPSDGIEIVRKSSAPKKLKMHEPEAGETKMHEKAEPTSVEFTEEEDGKTFSSRRASPGDTDEVDVSEEKSPLGEPDEIDSKLKAFLSKGKKTIKHKKS